MNKDEFVGGLPATSAGAPSWYGIILACSEAPGDETWCLRERFLRNIHQIKRAIAARAARGIATPMPILAPVLRPLGNIATVLGVTTAAVVLVSVIVEDNEVGFGVGVGRSLLLKFN